MAHASREEEEYDKRPEGGELRRQNTEEEWLESKSRSVLEGENKLVA